MARVVRPLIIDCTAVNTITATLLASVAAPSLAAAATVTAADPEETQPLVAIADADDFVTRFNLARTRGYGDGVLSGFAYAPEDFAGGQLTDRIGGRTTVANGAGSATYDATRGAIVGATGGIKWASIGSIPAGTPYWFAVIAARDADDNALYCHSRVAADDSVPFYVSNGTGATDPYAIPGGSTVSFGDPYHPPYPAVGFTGYPTLTRDAAGQNFYLTVMATMNADGSERLVVHGNERTILTRAAALGGYGEDRYLIVTAGATAVKAILWGTGTLGGLQLMLLKAFAGYCGQPTSTYAGKVQLISLWNSMGEAYWPAQEGGTADADGPLQYAATTLAGRGYPTVARSQAVSGRPWVVDSSGTTPDNALTNLAEVYCRGTMDPTASHIVLIPAEDVNASFQPGYTGNETGRGDKVHADAQAVLAKVWAARAGTQAKVLFPHIHYWPTLDTTFESRLRANRAALAAPDTYWHAITYKLHDEANMRAADAISTLDPSVLHWGIAGSRRAGVHLADEVQTLLGL